MCVCVCEVRLMVLQTGGLESEQASRCVPVKPLLWTIIIIIIGIITVAMEVRTWRLAGGPPWGPCIPGEFTLLGAGGGRVWITHSTTSAPSPAPSLNAPFPRVALRAVEKPLPCATKRLQSIVLKRPFRFPTMPAVLLFLSVEDSLR
ncbi:hypothetical protein QQF64_021776 [Cirrhinus molitorella]|uniref:Uncharacterized protein n=1 Tax=Cirrhinus molitorella TaxID=172907 RepID=A0ABR3L6K4_9TELE